MKRLILMVLRSQMKTIKSVVAVLVLGCVVAGLSGCRKEGPAERAGREIDRSVAKAGKEMEKAGAKMQDVIDRMKK